MSIDTIFLIVIWTTIILGLGFMIYLIIREEKKSEEFHKTRMIEIMKSKLETNNRIVEKIKEITEYEKDSSFDWRTGMYKDKEKKITQIDPRIEKYNFYKSLGINEEKIIELIDKEYPNEKRTG